MKQLRKVLRRQSKDSSSRLKVMDERVKSSPAWKGTLSMLEGKKMLDGQAPFTYILSEGVDKYHYFLHYVGVDHLVHFKNVRIRFIGGVPVYRNGGGDYCKSIEALVPSCLRCSSSICKPLI
jgi:hypothetical protein